MRWNFDHESLREETQRMWLVQHWRTGSSAERWLLLPQCYKLLKGCLKAVQEGDTFLLIFPPTHVFYIFPTVNLSQAGSFYQKRFVTFGHHFKTQTSLHLGLTKMTKTNCTWCQRVGLLAVIINLIHSHFYGMWDRKSHLNIFIVQCHGFCVAPCDLLQFFCSTWVVVQRCLSELSPEVLMVVAQNVGSDTSDVM